MILYKKFVLCLHIYKLFGKIFILLYSFKVCKALNIKAYKECENAMLYSIHNLNVNLGECYDF